jgi:hypothetical protein
VEVVGARNFKSQGDYLKESLKESKLTDRTEKYRERDWRKTATGRQKCGRENVGE